MKPQIKFISLIKVLNLTNCSDICSNSCLGKQNHHGGCCNVTDSGFALGKVTDALEFLKRLNNGLKYEDVFIDYEEGSKLFPDKKQFQNPSIYPVLRVDMNSERKFCIFYDQKNKLCSVYDIRPKVCQNYFCKHLKDIFGLELKLLNLK